jgi:hypothetical protein
MAQVIARVLVVLIGGIFDPPQLVLGGVGLQLGPGNIEKWPHQMPSPQRALTWHAGQPSHTGATQQAKQQGFRLIVAVLGGQQQFIGLNGFNESGIPRIPGRPLEAGARLDLNANDLQWHTQRITDRLAVFRPRICRSLKAVMDMESAQRRQGFGFGPLGEKVQQDGGVEAAGESNAPGFGVAPGGEILHESDG